MEPERQVYLLSDTRVAKCQRCFNLVYLYEGAAFDPDYTNPKADDTYRDHECRLPDTSFMRGAPKKGLEKPKNYTYKN